MLSHVERVLANLLEDRIVATERWYAIKFRLRRQRSVRMRQTKKREPHIGNKLPILVEHAAEEARCIDRLADALGVSRSDMRALQSATVGPWVAQAQAAAKRRVVEDRRAGHCMCHICEKRSQTVMI